MRRFRTPGLRPGGLPTVKDLQTSALQAKRQRNGNEAEKLVEGRLIARGFALVEKVEVPFRVGKDGKMSARRKVSGDFRAVEKGTGRSLLVEVKHHAERLSYGAFRPHQLVALEEHYQAGGISEVAWADRGQIHFIPWENLHRMGFGPGKSIHYDGTQITLYVPSRTSKKKATP